MRIFAVLMLTALLFGCGKEGELIDRAKDAALNNSVTFGQALENTPYCTDSDWSTEVDSRGRDVVVHKCTIELSKEQIKSHFEANSLTESKAKGYAYLNNIEMILNLSASDMRDGPGKKLPKEYDVYLQKLHGRTGANSYEEAAEILGRMQSDFDGDIQILRSLVEEYNSAILALAPDHDIEVERITKIIFLPHSIDWQAPVFYSEELDRSFQSDPFSIAVRDIEGRKSVVDTKTTIYDLINRGLFVFSNDYKQNSTDFRDFVSSQCDENGCPLAAMVTEQGWQDYFKEQDSQQ